MVEARFNINFSKTYWESRLKQIDCRDVASALDLIEEAYQLGRDDISYETLVMLTQGVKDGQTK